MLCQFLSTWTKVVYRDFGGELQVELIVLPRYTTMMKLLHIPLLLILPSMPGLWDTLWNTSRDVIADLSASLVLI